MNSREMINLFKRKQEAMIPVAQEYQKKAKAIEKKAQDEITKAGEQLRRMQEEYRADMKTTFGITDGEPADILTLLEAVLKMVDHKDGLIVK